MILMHRTIKYDIMPFLPVLLLRHMRPSGMKDQLGFYCLIKLNIQYVDAFEPQNQKCDWTARVLTCTTIEAEWVLLFYKLNQGGHTPRSKSRNETI